MPLYALMARKGLDIPKVVGDISEFLTISTNSANAYWKALLVDYRKILRTSDARLYGTFFSVDVCWT